MSGPGGAATPPGSAGSPVVSVAIEVSALRGGGHAAMEFVDFAVAALAGAADVELHAWSVRRLQHATEDGVAPRRSARARLGERAARLGLPVSTRWASPQAQVIFEASGPLALRALAPGLLTVHDADRPGDGRARRRRRERLQRAVGDGVVLHVMTSAHAEELAAELDVPRTAIIVAAPGVRAARHGPLSPPPATPRVIVLRGADPSRDQMVLEALRSAGANVELAATMTASPGTCCVLASPDERFPLAALEALASGAAVVVTRTPTTTELLEGAATLVDGSTQDVVDATMELCANDAARAIAVAAGRARADDYTWARRASELVAVVRRSLAAP